jgi:large subunit ribosomal protein L18
MRKTKEDKRKARHLRVRRKIADSSERPRLVIYRSLKHIYASLVDDDVKPNRVLTTVSSASKEFSSVAADGAKGGNVKGALLVGKILADKAKKLGVEKVVFDRAGYRYCGRVKALADSARQGGLKF